jgi:RNA polymerase sigma-70 factor (ECF subfamily)
MQNGAEDMAIIRKVLGGDNEAFSALVEKYGQAIHRRMRNYAKDAGAREELAHEVFIEAFMNLPKFRGDSPFCHWLSRIATLTGYKHWKAEERKKREVGFEEERDWVQNGRPDAEFDRDAARRLAYDLLAALPDNDRIVLTLAYLEDCSPGEIAERLGWSRPLAAVRMFRARGKLRKLASREPWKGKIQCLIP